MTNNDDLSRARGERPPPLWVDAFTRNTQGLFLEPAVG